MDDADIDGSSAGGATAKAVGDSAGRPPRHPHHHSRRWSSEDGESDNDYVTATKRDADESSVCVVHSLLDLDSPGAGGGGSSSNGGAHNMPLSSKDRTVPRTTFSLPPSSAQKQTIKTSSPSHSPSPIPSPSPPSPSPATMPSAPTTAATAPMSPQKPLSQPRSHHLTKRQLTELAWNVRALSRRLGRICLPLRARRIMVVTKPRDRSLVARSRDLVEWLLALDGEHGDGCMVYVDRRLEHEADFAAAWLSREGRAERLRFCDYDALQRQQQQHQGRRWRTTQKSGQRQDQQDLERQQQQQPNPSDIDLVVTLGGDGTVLYASALFQAAVPPVVTFALGSLGFLTKFDFNSFQPTLSHAFAEGVVVNLRLRFECTVMRSRRNRDRVRAKEADEPEPSEGGDEDLVDELIGSRAGTATHVADQSFQILNDVVLDRGPSPTMSALDIFGDDAFFTSVLGDGLCVSTPTGSTAYNLAAGGSLCYPDNPVMLLTAICAHTLNFRPLILPDTVVLRVGVGYAARASAWASFDGRDRVEVVPGDYVSIAASRYPFAAVLPSGGPSHEWVRRISETLNWNSRSRQRAFTD